MPEYHLASARLGVIGVGVQHRLHAGNGAHGDLRVVVPARVFVDPTALTDAQYDSREPRLDVVQLLEACGVHLPELRILGVEPAEATVEVRRELGGERGHVGAQEDVDAELVRPIPERPERVAESLCPPDVVVSLGVDGPIRHIGEGHELHRSRPRDGVVAVLEGALEEHLPVRVSVRQRNLVDVGRFGQVDVFERSGGMRVVGAGLRLRRVGVDRDRAEVEHAHRQSVGDFLPRPLVDRPAGTNGRGHVEQRAGRPRFVGRVDGERIGLAGQAVGLISGCRVVADLHGDGCCARSVRRSIQLPLQRLPGRVHQRGVGRIAHGDLGRSDRFEPGRHGRLRCRDDFGRLRADAEDVADGDSDAGSHRQQSD